MEINIYFRDNNNFNLMDKKYKIIYADPPWTFKTYSQKGKERSPEKHYHVMTKSDIQNLDVNSIADDDCVLFLWVTFPCLLEGLELIKSWGFTYKTVAFNWVKRNKKSNSWFWGMGYWTRANTEICLLATKGKPKRINMGVHMVLDNRVMAHSQKPDEARKRIVQLMGDLPRLEMFARDKSNIFGNELEGWDVFGNECKESIHINIKSNEKI